MGTEWLIALRQQARVLPLLDCPSATSSQHPLSYLEHRTIRRGKSEKLRLKLASPVVLECSTVRTITNNCIHKCAGILEEENSLQDELCQHSPFGRATAGKNSNRLIKKLDKDCYTFLGFVLQTSALTSDLHELKMTMNG
ncbi:hypothetical protein HPB47_012680 [Ixodes persulcatus]|uniref:Uncharacterized protein n=1 Tax=Ixodes persulcatus TaxID=34615 RepID=A0AC60NT10_IXOPE|nr:hypothetical protein HPB47_012680 [Ixodes persulcatus]